MTEAKFFATDPPPSLGEALWDFGTALGRASQVPERIQREPDPQTIDRDDTAVSVGDTGLMRDVAALLYSGDKAYMSRTGEAAVLGREETVRQIKEAIARNRAAMPSLTARDTYDDITNRRQKDWFAEIDRHAAAQQDVSIGEQSLARQRALAGIATATSSDAERLKNILTIEGEVFKRGMRQGKPPAQIESERFRAVSDVHAGVVRRLIDADDAPGAMAYLDANTDALGDAPEQELRAALRAPLARRQANDDVDHAIGTATRDPAALTFSYGDPVHGTGKQPIVMASGGWSVSAPVGVAVYPIAPGVATVSNDGRSVTVTHDDGSVSHYAGLGSQDIADGARVTPDTVIGAVGAPSPSDGSAPFGGSVLHYQVERGGAPVDPTNIAGPDAAAGAAQVRIDRMRAMGAINLRADREDWDEDRRIEALREVDRRVRREERSIADTRATARDAALTIAEALGQGFTDVAQIPAKILSALESDDLRRITAQAEANEHPVPVAEAGDTAADLNLMATRDRAAFAKEDLRLHRHEMTEVEYGDLSKLQADIRANPNSPAAATNDAIWRWIGNAGSHLVHPDDDTAASEALKLHTSIKREVDRITQGEREPSRQEIADAYDQVMREKFASLAYTISNRRNYEPINSATSDKNAQWQSAVFHPDENRIGSTKARWRFDQRTPESWRFDQPSRETWRLGQRDKPASSQPFSRSLITHEQLQEVIPDGPVGGAPLTDAYGFGKAPYLDITPGDGAVSFAMSHIGDGSYEYTDPNPHARGTIRGRLGGVLSLKCNALVYDALHWTGAAASLMGDGRIPSAGEWGDRKVDIGHYPVVTRYTVPAGGLTEDMKNQLREGDVISDGHHVGLVTVRFGDVQSVSAASPAAYPPWGGVVRNDWGFRPGQHIIVRRFKN